MTMRMILTTVAVLGVAANAVAAPAGFNKRADAVLSAAVPANGPGISAVATENGRIIWRGAAGRGDVAKAVPLGTDGLFRYASITKQFTAALTLKLVDDGRLSLDDNLGKLLPAETPAAWHKVTLRQLLNHTSGIPSYTDQPGFMTESNTAKPYTTQALIDLTRDRPMDFEPGSKWAYNNTGYVLLSAIVEKLTGKPWYVAMRERITVPLGLASIRCGCEPGPATVTGHTQKDAVAQRIDMTVPSGAGALVGNASDLAKWAAALHGGKVLKPATYQAMITPANLPADSPLRYGFGLAVGEVRGLSTIEHSGGIFGFGTESIYVPSRKLFVAALGNSDSDAVNANATARRLVAEAAGVAFPVLNPQKADLAALEPFFGVYKDKAGERRFFTREGKLFTQRGSGTAFEVFAAGGDRYFYGNRSLSYFELKPGQDGKGAMHFHANGALQPEIATWTGPVPVEAAGAVLSEADRAALVGTYAAGPMVLTITAADAKLTAQLTGQPPIPLEAIGARELRTVGVDARLVFEEVGGRIARVVLHQGGRTMLLERK